MDADERVSVDEQKPTREEAIELLDKLLDELADGYLLSMM